MRYPFGFFENMNEMDRENYANASEFMEMGCSLYFKSQDEEIVTNCTNFVESNFFSSELGMFLLLCLCNLVTMITEFMSCLN